MISWDGMVVSINQGVKKALEIQKQKKTRIYVVAGIIALGIILFIKGK